VNEIAQQRRYPSRLPTYALALKEHPIEIDGMRVVFDEKVALFPIRVARRKKVVRRRVDR
jgi:hypothetical protein